MAKLLENTSQFYNGHEMEYGTADCFSQRMLPAPSSLYSCGRSQQDYEAAVGRCIALHVAGIPRLSGAEAMPQPNKQNLSVEMRLPSTQHMLSGFRHGDGPPLSRQQPPNLGLSLVQRMHPKCGGGVMMPNCEFQRQIPAIGDIVLIDAKNAHTETIFAVVFGSIWEEDSVRLLVKECILRTCHVPLIRDAAALSDMVLDLGDVQLSKSKLNADQNAAPHQKFKVDVSAVKKVLSIHTHKSAYAQLPSVSISQLENTQCVKCMARFKTVPSAEILSDKFTPAPTNLPSPQPSDPSTATDANCGMTMFYACNLLSTLKNYPPGRQ